VRVRANTGRRQHTDTFMVSPSGEPRLAERTEQKLVLRYCDYMATNPATALVLERSKPARQGPKSATALSRRATLPQVSSAVEISVGT
jgi:hypothetical protein